MYYIPSTTLLIPQSTSNKVYLNSHHQLPIKNVNTSLHSLIHRNEKSWSELLLNLMQTHFIQNSQFYFEIVSVWSMWKDAPGFVHFSQDKFNAVKYIKFLWSKNKNLDSYFTTTRCCNLIEITINFFHCFLTDFLRNVWIVFFLQAFII